MTRGVPDSTLVRRLHRAALQVFRRLPVGGRRFVVRRLSPSYTVGTICVIQREDNRILLARLSYRGRWGFPGGLVQRDESTEDCARREAREETSLEVVLEGPPAVIVEEDPRRVDVIFRARPAPGQDPDAVVTDSPEIDQLRWFHPDELPELQREAATALMALGRNHAELAQQVRVRGPRGR